MEKTMNKNNKKLLVGVAVVAIAISSILGVTFSKYNTVVTGSGETEIAKWNFKVNTSSSQFATIDLEDTYDEATLINGKIAPGTSGSFDLVIDASDAEVGVDYKVDFLNETNKPTNLKFSYNETTLDEIEDYEEYFKGTIDADDTNKTRTLTVNWEWEYETGDNTNTISANDAIDTSEGLSALDYTFDVIVTGTQVVPTK